MKTGHKIGLLLMLVFAVSCVSDDDFKSPDLSFQEPVLDGNLITMASVKGNLLQSGEDVVSFTGTNTYLSGYVISSDSGGNFFRELIIQDTAEDPRAGIAIQINVTPLSTRFEFGRKVYIKLDGLTVTNQGGTLELGIRNGNRISPIPASLLNEHVLRSVEIAEIVPLIVTFEEFSDALENLYVQVKQVQFSRKEVLGISRKTFASEATDQFDGERILENCNSNATALLSTSTFSDFKALLLPQGSGSLNAVLSRDFYDDFYILKVNSPEDINFRSSQRCDPLELQCGLAEIQGAKVLFEDRFETQIRNRAVTGNGWTNYIEFGTQSWEAYTATGSNASQGISVRMDSYQSGDAKTVTWLVTPAVDLDSNTNVRVRFETSSSFADGSDLEVLFTTNWDGNPATLTSATWGVLSDAFIIRDQDFFGSWYSSGIVRVSCASGRMHIAFKYTGSGQDAFDGTYELDNVRITAD